MEAIMPYHNVQTLDGLPLSVRLAVVPGNSAIDVTIELLGDADPKHPNHIHTSAAHIALPAPFEAVPQADRIRSVVTTLLKADGQASRNLANGSVVTTRVSATPPTSTATLNESSNLEAYRSSRLGAADLIRPMLLAEPTLDRLRTFQLEGVHWLTKRPKAILADDMGLGKTIQAISALRLLFNAGTVRTALIICPKSLLAHWDEELSRWAPELGRVRLVPTASIREQAWRVLGTACHVILTNYEQMRNPTCGTH